MYGAKAVWHVEMQTTDNFIPQRRSMYNKYIITAEKIFIKYEGPNTQVV